MSKQIDSIKKVRLFLLDHIKDLSIDQVNKVPTSFNNNIVWNLGHLIAAQQGICYLRAGVKPAVDEKYINSYKSGTKPGGYIEEQELSTLKKMMLSSLDQLETDYQNNLFVNYNGWSTRYGVDLGNIDDAIDFLGFHEGLHNGVITLQKKLVDK